MAEEREVWRFEAEDDVSPVLDQLLAHYRQVMGELERAAGAVEAGGEAGGEVEQVLAQYEQAMQRLQALRPEEYLRGPAGEIYTPEQAQEWVAQQAEETGRPEEELWEWFQPATVWRDVATGRFVGRAQVEEAVGGAEEALEALQELQAPPEQAGAAGQAGLGQALAQGTAGALQSLAAGRFTEAVTRFAEPILQAAAPYIQRWVERMLASGSREQQEAYEQLRQRVREMMEQGAGEEDIERVLQEGLHAAQAAGQAAETAPGAAAGEAPPGTEAGAEAAAAAGAGIVEGAEDVGTEAAESLAGAFAAALPGAVAGAVAAVGMILLQRILGGLERLWHRLRQELQAALQAAWEQAFRAMDWEAITGGASEGLIQAREAARLFGVDLERVLAEPLPMLQARFRALGMDISQALEGQESWVQVLGELRQRYSQIEDPMQRVIFLQRAFGSHWREMIPLMEISNSLWEQYNRVMQHVAATEQERQVAMQWRMARGALSEEWEALLRAVAAPAMEAELPTLRGLTEALGALVNLLQRGEEVATWFFRVLSFGLRELLPHLGPVAALLHDILVILEGLGRVEPPGEPAGAQQGQAGAAGGGFTLQPALAPTAPGVQGGYGPPWQAPQQQVDINVRVGFEVRAKPDWLDIIAEDAAEAEYRRATRS